MTSFTDRGDLPPEVLPRPAEWKTKLDIPDIYHEKTTFHTRYYHPRGEYGAWALDITSSLYLSLPNDRAEMLQTNAEAALPPRLTKISDTECIKQLVGLVGFLNKKWWQDLQTGAPIERNVGEILMLVTSELGEALEGHRKNLMDQHLPHRRSFEVEIADAIIRLLDIGANLKVNGEHLDLPGAIVEKLVYNINRQDHTREHRLTENGKKY